MKVELSLYEIWELHGAMELCESEGTSQPRTDMKHLFEAKRSVDSWSKLKLKLEEILNKAMAEEKDSHGQEKQVGKAASSSEDDR